MKINKLLRFLKDSWIYILILCVVISIFTLIKAPYWDEPLTSPHPMKLQRSAGPALGMFITGNPFRYELFFKVNPISEEPGVFRKFPFIPWKEWGTFIFLNLFPNQSIQFNTHLFANVLGILIIVLSFIYFSYSWDRNFAIIFVTLLSLSYHLNLISFTTPQDPIMFIFMFLSLIFLEQFLRNSNPKALSTSAILGGLGINAKYSLALILLPLVLIQILSETETRSEFLASASVFFLFLVLPETIFRTSFQYVPTNPFHLAITTILILAVYYIYRKSKSILNVFHSFWSYNISRPFYFISTLIIIGGMFYAFWEFLGFSRYLEKFLVTDIELLFNYDLYRYMIIEQLKPLITISILQLSLLGLILLLVPTYIQKNKHRVMIFSFISGLLAYWIPASKVIFFHSYYKFMFSLVISLLTTIFFYMVYQKLTDLIKFYTSESLSVMLSHLIIMSLILIALLPHTNAKISDNFEVGEINKAVNYLRNNTEQGDLFLSQGSAYVLGLPARRKSVNIPSLEKEWIKEEIVDKGLTEFLKDNQITYFISEGKPNFSRIGIFSKAQEAVMPIGEYRTKLIKYKIGQSREEPKYIRTEKVQQDKFKKYFVFKKNIQGFHFYKTIQPTSE